MAREERVYKCLSPVGNQPPVDVFPLAPRLDTMIGKEIWFSICGEPDITIFLEKELKNRYPDTDWKIKKTYGVSPVQLSDEEMKTCDGVIQGVSW